MQYANKPQSTGTLTSCQIYIKYTLGVCCWRLINNSGLVAPRLRFVQCQFSFDSICFLFPTTLPYTARPARRLQYQLVFVGLGRVELSTYQHRSGRAYH